MGVEFKDNTEKILKEFNTRKGVALNLIGSQVQKHTIENTPVRTGNLRDHADWEVSNDEEYVEVGFKKDADKNKDPFYAIYVEMGSITNKPQHMLQKAVENHTNEYKAIAKQALENS